VTKWLIVWVNGVRIGSVPLTDENLARFKSEFHMALIQRDASGTEHWNALARKKQTNRRKRAKA
jgi:hypothetical protein